MESSQVLSEDRNVLAAAGARQWSADAEAAVGGAVRGEREILAPRAAWSAHAELAALPAPRDRRLTYVAAKRIIDLTFCLVALPVLSVLLIAIAIAIRLDSPGPILFAQTRVGRGGRSFRMYKFRTLRADYDPRRGVAYMQAFVRGDIAGEGAAGSAEVNKPLHTSDMTRLGRFLREASLDELPQIWNVLRGDMTLVGPRPNVEWEVAAYADWHRERLDAVPGITGLAQVRGRSWVSFDRIALCDIEYVRRQSLLLDLYIVWMTVRCVFDRDGAG